MIKVATIPEAWELAYKLADAGEYELDKDSEERAGYPIFREKNSYYSRICDLGCHLEIMKADGTSVNVWIEPQEPAAEEPAHYGNELAEKIKAKTEEGYDTVVPIRGNIASGKNAHSEGNQTTATGSGAHAEGHGTMASGNASHTEGGRFTGDVGCIASGYGSHAEGVSTKASASGAHSEGRGTIASEESSHSEGYRTTASGPRAHAEGVMTIAANFDSHAEGNRTQALSTNSHTGGDHTIAEYHSEKRVFFAA